MAASSTNEKWLSKYLGKNQSKTTYHIRKGT